MRSIQAGLRLTGRAISETTIVRPSIFPLSPCHEMARHQQRSRTCTSPGTEPGITVFQSSDKYHTGQVPERRLLVIAVLI